jgi:hypothetical protein
MDEHIHAHCFSSTSEEKGNTRKQWVNHLFLERVPQGTGYTGEGAEKLIPAKG